MELLLRSAAGERRRPVQLEQSRGAFLAQELPRRRCFCPGGCPLGGQGEDLGERKVSACAVAGCVGEGGDRHGIPAQLLGLSELAAAPEDTGAGAAPPELHEDVRWERFLLGQIDPGFRRVRLPAVEQQIRQLHSPRCGIGGTAGDLQRLDARPCLGFGRRVIACD